jgi:hypothetical protein
MANITMGLCQKDVSEDFLVLVSFIGGGNRSIRTKPLSCHKLELNTYTESVRSQGFCTNQLIEGNCTPLFHIC